MGARKWVIGGFLAAVLLVVGLGVYAARAKENREQNETKSELATAVARAEALGLPIYAEHLRGDPIPDDENAWVEIEAIRKMTEGRTSPGGSWTTRFDLFDVTDPSELDRLTRKMVADWQPALNLAKLAAAKPSFDPRREWEFGEALLFPDLPQTKGVCFVLVEEARLQFDAGDFSSSLKSLKAAVAVADFHYGERYWFSSLVAYSIDSKAVQEIVRQAWLDAPELHDAELRELLDRMYRPTDPTKMLTAQIVTFVETIRLVNEDNERGMQVIDEYHEIEIGVNADKMFGSSAPARYAIEFEAKAINAACEYFEALSNDLTAYVSNDEHYAELVSSPFDWNFAVYFGEDDGHAMPLGFLALYEA